MWVCVVCACVYYHKDVTVMFVQYLCQTYPDVNEKVHNAMGDILYERFMVCLLYTSDAADE